MTLLQEIIGYYNLTDSQKKVLITCIVSGTPQQAFEFTIGDTNLVQSRNTLTRLGLINVQGNQMGITEKGQAAARNYNLVDETGQLTPDAVDLLQGTNAEQSATPSPPESEANVSQ